MERWLGYGFIFLSAACYAVLSIVVKIIYELGMPEITVIILQSLGSTLLIWLVIAVTRKSASVPRILWARLAAQGIIGGFGTTLLFFLTLGRLGASLTTLLYFTFPFFVVVYNTLFRRVPITISQTVSLLIVIAGLFLTIDLQQIETGVVSFTAILMGFGAALGCAFLYLNGEKLLESLDTIVVTAWSFTFSLITMLLVYHPWWLLEIHLAVSQTALLLSVAVLTVIPVGSYLAGIRRIGSGNAAIVSTLEIPLTLFLAGWILHEMLNIVQLTGAVLITLGVASLYYFARE